MIALLNKNTKSLHIVPFNEISIKNRFKYLPGEYATSKLPGVINIQCRYITKKEYENSLKNKENNINTENNTQDQTEKKQIQPGDFETFNKSKIEKIRGIFGKFDSTFKFQFRGKTPNLPKIDEGKFEDENDDEELKKSKNDEKNRNNIFVVKLENEENNEKSDNEKKMPEDSKEIEDNKNENENENVKKEEISKNDNNEIKDGNVDENKNDENEKNKDKNKIEKENENEKNEENKCEVEKGEKLHGIDLSLHESIKELPQQQKENVQTNLNPNPEKKTEPENNKEIISDKKQEDVPFIKIPEVPPKKIHRDGLLNYAKYTQNKKEPNLENLEKIENPPLNKNVCFSETLKDISNEKRINISNNKVSNNPDLKLSNENKEKPKQISKNITKKGKVTKKQVKRKQNKNNNEIRYKKILLDTNVNKPQENLTDIQKIRVDFAEKKKNVNEKIFRHQHSDSFSKINNFKIESVENLSIKCRNHSPFHIKNANRHHIQKIDINFNSLKDFNNHVFYVDNQIRNIRMTSTDRTPPKFSPDCSTSSRTSDVFYQKKNNNVLRTNFIKTNYGSNNNYNNKIKKMPVQYEEYREIKDNSSLEISDQDNNNNRKKNNNFRNQYKEKSYREWNFRNNKFSINSDQTKSNYSYNSDTENYKKRYMLNNQKKTGIFKTGHLSPIIRRRTEISQSWKDFNINKRNNYLERYINCSRGSEGAQTISTKNKIICVDNSGKYMNRINMTDNQNDKKYVSKINKYNSPNNHTNNNINTNNFHINKEGQRKYYVPRNAMIHEKYKKEY